MRAWAALALLLSVGLLGVTAAPPALAATTGTAEVTITGGGADYYFAGDWAMFIGQVSPVEPSLGWPTGTVRVISHEPGNPTEEADLFFQDEGGLFSSWAHPTQVGVRQITIEYSGDATFAPKSQVLNYTVPPGPLTKTTLGISPSGAVTVGQKVTLTSNSTDDQGRTLEGYGAGGGVTFYDNGVRIGDEISAEDGTKPGKTLFATLTTSFATPGKHVITATFRPSFPAYYESTSAPVTITVKAASTPTPEPTATPATPAAVGGSFTVSPRGAVKAGSSVRATAEIHARAGGKAVAGAVQFYDGAVKVGKPVALVKGHAVMKYTHLAAGRHVLKAKYMGTSAYAAAFTRNVTVTVRK